MLFPPNGREGGYIKVWKVDDITQQQIYQYQLGRDVATEELLYSLTGGGTYLLKEKVPDHTGRLVFGRYVKLKLAGMPKPLTIHVGLDGKPDGSTPVPAAAPSPAPTVGTLPASSAGPQDVISAGILQMFQSFQAMQSQQTALMNASLERIKGSGIKWELILPAIIPLVTGLLGNKKDPVEIAREIAALMKPEQPAQDMISQLKSFMELRDMLDTGGGGGEKADPLLSGIPALLDIIKTEQEMKRQQQPPAPPRPATDAAALAPGTPAGAPGQPQAAPQGASDVPAWLRILGAQRGRLLGLAKAGKSPALYAQLAIDMMPQGVKGDIREFLAHEDHVDQVLAAMPELAAYEQWVVDFFGTAADILLGPVESTDDTQGADDDTTEQGEPGTE